MLVILYQDGCQDAAEKVALELVSAFGDQVKIMQVAAASAAAWPTAISWDDLLIVYITERISRLQATDLLRIICKNDPRRHCFCLSL